MAYNTAQARQDMLDDIARAADELAAALAALGDAFEQLDDFNAEKLEQEMFRPVQAAYGRAKRTHKEFAGRHGLPDRAFAPAGSGHPTTGVKGFVDNAVRAVEQADGTIATLQDSMRPVDVGDAELRAGLSEVRRLVGDVPGRARRFVSGLGR
jgi:ABC-type transporter Mla subunit MlaD